MSYVAQYFQGKRFYQLTFEEQQLLAHRLRTLMFPDEDSLL